MQQSREAVDAGDDGGARLIEKRVVDGVDRGVEVPPAGLERLGVAAFALPAGVENHVVGVGGRDGLGVDFGGPLAGRNERGRAAGGADEVGDPVAGGHRRVGPLLAVDGRVVAVGDRVGDAGEVVAAVLGERRAGAGVARGVADDGKRVEHLGERRGRDVEHVVAAVAGRRRDVRLEVVAGADGVGVEFVDSVEIWVQPAADDRLVGRRVNGRPDDVSVETGGIEDGRRARRERDDAGVGGHA